jgi:hypothetical protein
MSTSETDPENDAASEPLWREPRPSIEELDVFKDDTDVVLHAGNDEWLRMNSAYLVDLEKTA